MSAAAIPLAATRSRIEALARETPAWRGWLSLVEVLVEEIDAHRQAVGVEPSPTAPAARDAAALDGSVLRLDARAASRWTTRWLKALAEHGGAAFAALERRANRSAIDPFAYLEAAARGDDLALDAVAARLGCDPAAFRAVAARGALPVLHAARESVHGSRTSGRGGACPSCLAWPTLAESRGLSQEFRLRCARCGEDAPGSALACAFCAVEDPERLRSLVPDGKPTGRRVLACLSCRAYVKVIPTLAPLGSSELLLEDLATTDLDVVAAERDFARPARPPRVLDVRVRALGARA